MRKRGSRGLPFTRRFASGPCAWVEVGQIWSLRSFSEDGVCLDNIDLSALHRIPLMYSIYL